MTILVILGIVGFVTAEAVPCSHTQHCSDCDRETGDCLTECDTGYYDRRYESTCSRNCRNNTCVLSEHGNDDCTDGCVPGYSGLGCHIPCDSPGGNCTPCPGGCDGGYCQLGSSCVSGCADSYYGTDCENCSSGCTSCNRLTGTCDEKPGADVGMLVGLSASLATASVLVIVIVVLVVCWCCRPLRRDRFQLYVTPTQDMHAPTENIDAPQYAVVDEAGMYDVSSCQGKPAYPSRPDYELGTSFTTCPSP